MDSLGKGSLVQAEHPGPPGTWGKPVEGLGRGQGGWRTSVPTGNGALSPPPSIRQSDAPRLDDDGGRKAEAARRARKPLSGERRSEQHGAPD